MRRCWSVNTESPLSFISRVPSAPGSGGRVVVVSGGRVVVVAGGAVVVVVGAVVVVVGAVVVVVGSSVVDEDPPVSVSSEPDRAELMPSPAASTITTRPPMTAARFCGAVNRPPRAVCRGKSSSGSGTGAAPPPELAAGIGQAATRCRDRHKLATAFPTQMFRPSVWMTLPQDRPTIATKRRREYRRYIAWWVSRSELLERRPGQEQPLLPDVAEPHEGLGLVAAAAHADDDPLAEDVVAHVVAGLEAQPVRAAAPRLARFERLVDDALPAGRHPQRRVATGPPIGAPPAAPAAVGATAAAGPAVPFHVAHQVGGDLVEEPARRGFLGAARQRAAPRVAEVEPAPGPGDAHVGEPAL